MAFDDASGAARYYTQRKRICPIRSHAIHDVDMW
jgi:hypothetical protein